MHARLMPILAFAGLAFSCVTVAEPIGAAGPALRARYDELQQKLAHNAYGKPLFLVSSEEANRLRGDVYAVVGAPFAAADAGFAEAASWCDVLILPFNTKHCVGTKSG